MLSYLKYIIEWRPDIINYLQKQILVIGVVLAIIILVLIKKDNHWREKVYYWGINSIYFVGIYMVTIGGRLPDKYDLSRLFSFSLTSEYLIQCLLNIMLFIPMGIIVFKKYNSILRTVLICVLIAVEIEILQYVLQVGFSEIIDIFTNAIGGGIGIGMLNIKRWLRNHR